MNSILKIFNEPYPLEEDFRMQLLMNAIIAVIVVLILAIFQPFGLENVNIQIPRSVFIYSGYGAVTFLICMMSDRLIKPAFPLFFDEQKWTVGKNIFWVVFIITFVGVANLFYSNALGFTGVSGTSLLNFQLYTVAVSILPVSIVTLLTMVRLLKKNLKEAKQINESMRSSAHPEKYDALLTFTSDNGRDVIRLKPDQFLYAESADNYSDIVYIENAIVRRELIRSTLKRIEETNDAEFVQRVHRSYIVNLLQVKNVTGNSQGYRLVFDPIEETVPVAKRLSEKVKSVLELLHKDELRG